jgi:hypothetical protein
MTTRKAMTMLELCAALVERLWPRQSERMDEVKPDHARSARIKKYIAKTMSERYGDHGPP